MSQPPTYNRATSFTNLQVTNPTGQPQGPDLDVEFNNIKAALDAIEANLALIQRDDGALANESVGLNQLSDELSVGFSAPTAWATATAYVSSPASTVFHGTAYYRCLVSHTSGTFATDLTAVKWVLIADLSAIPLVAASQIAVTASGLLTTDVQGSLAALDAGKAALSHTHTASAISDSTAAGRNMLKAASVAAQQALLGLGSLAYLSSVSISSVTAQLALTAYINATALIVSTNDWAPTGLATATRVRFSATSAVNVTGLLATSDGDIKILDNVGTTYAVTLTAEDASSAAANRFAGPVDIVLRAKESLILVYDGVAARWRMLGVRYGLATNGQAIALADNTVVMTPLRTNDAIGAYVTANPVTVNPFGTQFLHVQDQKTSGTAGGTFTNGAWRTRTLNTSLTNQITGASLGSSQITLPAGTYQINAEASGFACDAHKAKLYNTTDAADVLMGTNEYCTTSVTGSWSRVYGRFTIAGAKVFELQHRCVTTGTWGIAASLGTEVYANVMIWRVL